MKDKTLSRTLIISKVVYMKRYIFPLTKEYKNKYFRKIII